MHTIPGTDFPTQQCFGRVEKVGERATRKGRWSGRGVEKKSLCTRNTYIW